MPKLFRMHSIYLTHMLEEMSHLCLSVSCMYVFLKQVWTLNEEEMLCEILEEGVVKERSCFNIKYLFSRPGVGNVWSQN